MNLDFGSIGNFVKGVASTATQIYAAKAQIEAAKAASRPVSPAVSAAPQAAQAPQAAHLSFPLTAPNKDQSVIIVGLIAVVFGLWIVAKK
jgi:hypothetical protein